MCGIFGMFSRVAMPMVQPVHDGMIMLQHRGHEAAGAAFFDEKVWTYERRLAETGSSVAHFFKKFRKDDLVSVSAVAHTRYSTAGGIDKIDNIQPFFVSTKYGNIAIAHNGNLIRAQKLKAEMLRDVIFSSDSDTEIILQLIARSKKGTIIEAVVETLETVGGSFSLLILTENELIAARDPFGFRPATIAEFENGFMVASETCAFDPLRQRLRARVLRDIEPGEVVVINKFGLSTVARLKSERVAQCIFELIYFARPDSTVFGWAVDEFRELCGTTHARLYADKVDCVIAVPDSSNFYADGLAKGLKVPHERALVRNHSSGRTFIDPNQVARGKNVRLKLNPIPRRINDRNIVICDDSIVRGTTSKKVINMVKACGPKSVRFSIGSPPVKHPCFYGIDTPTEKELIAAQISPEEIANFLGVDNLGYFPLEKLKKIGGKDFCYACFDGDYPLK